MNTRVDYIIVGQGLAGSAFALECMKRGKRVMVFDSPDHNRSSAIAAGICNPITGKGLSKTFLADKIFPFIRSWYGDAEKLLGESFFTPKPVYRPFLSLTEQQQWLTTSSSDELKNFVDRVWTSAYKNEELINPFGGLELKQSGVLASSRWLQAVRTYLLEKNMFAQGLVNEEEIQVDTEITYQDIEAKHLVFCNGLAARKSRWFNWLPIRPLKGETLSVRMNFPQEKIISRGVYVVSSGQSDVFTVGSTYEHEPFDLGTTPDALADLNERLRKLMRVPYEVIHQDWGIRPTVSDRRPLLGSHPEAQNVIIFNGMGTKGVSLTPYFASTLVDWLEKGFPLPEEVNISRFKTLYSD